MNSIYKNFRTKLFAGLATLLPLYLTYVVLKFLFESLEKISVPILIKFGLYIPGLGILLTIVLIYLLGIIVTNFLGKKVFNIGENLVKKVPIVNTIYTTLKQITDTFTKGTTDAFEGVVYIEYPRKGLWTMAFISGESKSQDEIFYYHLFALIQRLFSLVHLNHFSYQKVLCKVFLFLINLHYYLYILLCY